MACPISVGTGRQARTQHRRAPFGPDDQIRDAQRGARQRLRARRRSHGVLDLPPSRPATPRSPTAAAVSRTRACGASTTPGSLVRDPLRGERPGPRGPAVGPRRRHVCPHRPPARRAQAARQRDGRRRLRRSPSRSTTPPTAGSTTTRVNAIRAVPGPRRARARRAHARAATSAGATSTCGGCSRMIEESARRADAVGRVRAEQPAAVAATSTASCAGFLERLYRRGCSTARRRERGLLVALRRDDQSAVRAPTQGRVTCVVGVQPPYPAEFVVVRIGVTRSGIEVEETGGARMSKTGARLDPVPAFRFTVTFDDLPPGGFTRLHRPAGRRPRSRSTPRAGSTRTPGGFPAAPSRATSRSSAASSTGCCGTGTGRSATGDVQVAQRHRSSSTTRRASDDLIEFQLVDAFPVKWIGPGAGGRARTTSRSRPSSWPIRGCATREVSDAGAHRGDDQRRVAPRRRPAAHAGADREARRRSCIARLDERARDAKRAGARPRRCRRQASQAARGGRADDAGARHHRGGCQRPRAQSARPSSRCSSTRPSTRIAKGAQIAEIAIPGIDSPILQFVRGQTQTLTLELFFDTTRCRACERSR